MKALQTIIAVATLLHAANTFAQTEEAEDATSYKAEVFGSASSGSTTPFWMVSNRYGVVPLDANNGYLNAGVFHQQHFGKGFRWSAGPVSYTHLTLPTKAVECRSRWSPYH